MLDTSIDSFNFYFLVAVFQGFVLALIIIFRKPIQWTNVYLGILIFLSSLSLLHGVLEKSIHAFNAKFIFPMEYGFVLGPLIHFHVRQIIQPGFQIGLRHIVHFIPSLIFDVILFFGFFSYASSNPEWAEANIQAIQIFFLSIGLLFVMHISAYIFAAYRVTRGAEIKPRDYAPGIRKWLRIFIGCWIVSLLVLLAGLAWAIVNIEVFDQDSSIVYDPMGILKAVTIYLTGYVYLLKFGPMITRYFKDHERVITVKYDAAEILKKIRQLTEALEQHELYKDEKLTLEKLASHLRWPEKEVSAVIGEVFQSNFNDIINSYRVKAFMKLAIDPENKKYSIMGLAEKAGFNSKASFYRAFKKECGQTPTEFLSAKVR